MVQMAIPKSRTSASQATSFAIRQVYRNLLRSIPPSVRFSRPAASNLRRLIRDDFRPSPDQSGQGREGSDSVISEQDLNLKAQNTIALLLSSSYSRRLKTPPGPTASTTPSKNSHQPRQLSHKLLSNLASLTYHHLSPHTRMQSLSRTTGGSNLSSSSTLQSSSPSKFKSGSRRSKGSRRRLASLGSQGGADAEDDESVSYAAFEKLSSRSLPSLVLPAKPIRGPVASTSRPHWDGQNPYKYANNLSSQDVANLEEKVGALAEKLKSLREQGKTETPVGKEVKQDFVELRGTLKSKRGQLLKEEEALYREQKPVGLLNDLVGAIERTEHVWIGKNRWQKLQKGEWIEP